jgi:hypothetical protein
VNHPEPVNQAFAQIHSRGSGEELLQLCRACYTVEDWPFKLYLPESKDGHFQDLPVDKLEDLAITRPEGVEAEAFIKNDIELRLDPDEYIARFAITSARPNGQRALVYETEFGTFKGRPTDSTAPTNLPNYQPRPFDNP